MYKYTDLMKMTSWDCKKGNGACISKCSSNFTPIIYFIIQFWSCIFHQKILIQIWTKTIFAYVTLGVSFRNITKKATDIQEPYMAHDGVLDICSWGLIEGVWKKNMLYTIILFIFCFIKHAF